MVTLLPLQFLQGILTLIFVVISIIIGLLIIQRYFKFKQTQLLLVGITWILLISPYWPDALTFLSILIIDTELIDPVYFFLANALLPPLYYTWGTAFANFVLKDKSKNLVLAFFVVIGLIFETSFLGVYIINFNLIGTRITPFYVEWALFVDIFLIISILMFTITGIIFSIRALKSSDKSVHLKGIFLLIAFLTFAIGTSIDVIFTLSEITLVLARSFVIIGSISFYLGFTMPKFLKRALIKD